MVYDIIIIGCLAAVVVLNWWQGREIRDIKIVVGAMIYEMNKKNNHDA